VPAIGAGGGVCYGVPDLRQRRTSTFALCFARIPTPYSFPIGTSLDEPVLYSESRRTGDAVVLQLILWGDSLAKRSILLVEDERLVAVDYHLGSTNGQVAGV
jgi:hypothetical protein